MVSELKKGIRTVVVAVFLAFRALRRADRGSLIMTVVILAAVFLNLLFIDSVFTGVSATMDQTKIEYQFGEMIVEAADDEKIIADAPHVVDILRNLPGVRAISIHLFSNSTVTFDPVGDGREVNSMGASIMGVDPEAEAAAIDIPGSLLDGRYIHANERGVALVGAEIAGGYGSSVFQNDLGGVQVGDTITIAYTNGVTRDYDVVGIFKTKNFETDARIIVPRGDLDSVLGTHVEATEIIVRLDRKERAAQTVALARSLLGDSVKISDWYAKLAFGRSINQAFDMIGTMLRVIGAFVAGLVIFIIVFIDIVNRRKQIGILKAIGVRRSSIVLSYVIRGMVYTIVGMVLGYMTMRYGVTTYFSAHPIDFPMGPLVLFTDSQSLRAAAILFLIAGFIGSLIPALRETRKEILWLMR